MAIGWNDGIRNTDDIQCLCLHTIAQIREHSDRTKVSDGIRRLQPQALDAAQKTIVALFWADIPAKNLLGTNSHNHRLLLPSIVVLLWCSLRNVPASANESHIMRTLRSSIHTHTCSSIRALDACTSMCCGACVCCRAASSHRHSIESNRKVLLLLPGISWAGVVCLCLCACAGQHSYSLYGSVLAHALTIHASSRTEFAFICFERVECRCMHMNV